MASRRQTKKLMQKIQTATVPAAPVAPQSPVYASAGRYTTVNENGKVEQSLAELTKMSLARAAKRQDKMASLFQDGELGPANIADSNNIGYYSYQFPVDALEMPQSRAEELEFYRLAYNRDPIVARAIDLHCELPLSKMKLERPKCSVESFADYVMDYFQRLVNDTRVFNEILHATREYHVIGEAFLFIEQPENFGELELCEEAIKAIKKGRGFQAGVEPQVDGTNGPVSGSKSEVLPDFIQSRRKQSSKKLAKVAKHIELALADIGEDSPEDPDEVHKLLLANKKKLAKLLLEAPKPKAKTAALKKKADDPPPPPTGGGDPPIVSDSPGATPDLDAPGGEGEIGGEGGDIGGGDDGGMGMDLGGGGGGMGGGGFGDDPIPGDMAGDASQVITDVEEAKRAREINALKLYVHLLEKKKTLLEELEELKEEETLEKEIFQHIVNPNYEGFEKIQLLQPERITIENESGDQPNIKYKPSESEKEAHMGDPEVDSSIKDQLAEDGTLTLNANPFMGSYVIHFARKKSGYELHGRSALQSTMRAIIYREKLRQVQTTLASRNMTPKTLITAPGVSEVQVAQLRAHADEAKADPDYTIVTNYAVDWNEIDASSRLLQLADEWQHTNSNLAIGLGFSPEILIGEGMYGGNKIQLELMSNTYVQYRESVADIIENQIFKQIAMIKGFYELDNYGRPRWIYPKVTFGQLALRDSGDTFELMFNLYSKGSLPISVIYDFLGIDAETVTNELEDDLFTVKDSKFNEFLSSLYGSLGGEFSAKTDVIKRLAKNIGLNETEPDQGAEIEGSGEGM